MYAEFLVNTKVTYHSLSQHLFTLIWFLLLELLEGLVPVQTNGFDDHPDFVVGQERLVQLGTLVPAGPHECGDVVTACGSMSVICCLA